MIQNGLWSGFVGPGLRRGDKEEYGVTEKDAGVTEKDAGVTPFLSCPRRRAPTS